jgi:hypothetical protein
MLITLTSRCDVHNTFTIPTKRRQFDGSDVRMGAAADRLRGSVKKVVMVS